MSTTQSPFKGKITIKPFGKEGGLSQIYSSGWECAFASKDNEQCHPFVLCKDFLPDAVRAFLDGNSASIYGFTYNAKVNPRLDMDISYTVDPAGTKVKKKVKGKKELVETDEVRQIATVTGRTRILTVNQSDKDFLSKTAAVLDLIHQFEKPLDLDLTEAFEVENELKSKSGCVLYVTSSRWQEAPPMLSLYTLLLRTGCVHKIGDKWQTTLDNVINGKVKPYQANDAHYLKQARPKIDQIMKIGYRPIFYIDPKKNYPSKIEIGTLHNSTGIVAFATGASAKAVPHWSRKDLANKPSLLERAANKSNNENKVQEKFGEV